MAQILVLHGPNLNLLGEREPEVYGYTTLDEINQRLQEVGQTAGHSVTCFQTNAEHELIERIHLAKNEGVDFIIINPGAFTHSSIALRDALLGVEIPFIEVHLSNVFSREEFRRHSFLSDIAVGIISGMGALGYELAIQAVANHLKK
jgi:3-dehydroquinate dehydratase-2